MSYIGATGLTEYEERFDTIEEEIDANANYINTLVGIPDPIHLAIYGINVFNPGLYGLVERAEANIGLNGVVKTGLYLSINNIKTEIDGVDGTGLTTGIKHKLNILGVTINGADGTGTISGLYKGWN
jgi:hypothetical protein